MTERIGRAAREKWIAFLDRALDLEYLTFEEYKDRTEIVLSAVTRGDIDSKVLHDFSGWQFSDWNKEWEKRRENGLALPDGIHLPEEKAETFLPAPELNTGDKAAMILIIAIIILPWVLFALSLTGVL